MARWEPGTRSTRGSPPACPRRLPREGGADPGARCGPARGPAEGGGGAADAGAPWRTWLEPALALGLGALYLAAAVTRALASTAEAFCLFLDSVRTTPTLASKNPDNRKGVAMKRGVLSFLVVGVLLSVPAGAQDAQPGSQSAAAAACAAREAFETRCPGRSGA